MTTILRSVLLCVALGSSAVAWADNDRDTRTDSRHLRDAAPAHSPRDGRDARPTQRTNPPRGAERQARHLDRDHHRQSPSSRQHNAHPQRHYQPPRGHRPDYRYAHPRPRHNPRAWVAPRHFHAPRYSVHHAYDIAWHRLGLNVERAYYDKGCWVLYGFSVRHGPLRVVVDSTGGLLLGYHPWSRSWR
ncbi:MAG: hypothetical protein ABF296_01985 [Oceanococcaceae bacterium]